MSGVNKDLRRTTVAEDVWLWRYRKGWSQAQAANALHMSRTHYQLLESGRAARRTFCPSRGTRCTGEACALARRRSGLGLTKTATLYGVSRPTLINHEAKSLETLRQFWEKRGFTFA